jgi:hypothetical protein
MTEDAPKQLPILEQRRIEAEVIKPIHAEMVAQLGKETADRILNAAIEKAAVAQASTFAARDDVQTDLDGFVDIMKYWTANGALEIEVVGRTETTFDFNVKRCKYSEMYKAMGLGEIGHLLSCNRDGAFCTGFNPNLKLERTQTLMSGAGHCDFRYTFETER